jgi:hypothetical protein
LDTSDTALDPFFARTIFSYCVLSRHGLGDWLAAVIKVPDLDLWFLMVLFDCVALALAALIVVIVWAVVDINGCALGFPAFGRFMMALIFFGQGSLASRLQMQVGGSKGADDAYDPAAVAR